MKLRVVFLLALALFAFGASMLIGLESSIPRLHNLSYNITRNVSLTMQPCGDPVDGPDLPH